MKEAGGVSDARGTSELNRLVEVWSTELNSAQQRWSNRIILRSGTSTYFAGKWGKLSSILHIDREKEPALSWTNSSKVPCTTYAELPRTLCDAWSSVSALRTQVDRPCNIIVVISTVWERCAWRWRERYGGRDWSWYEMLSKPIKRSIKMTIYSVRYSTLL